MATAEGGTEMVGPRAALFSAPVVLCDGEAPIDRSKFTKTVTVKALRINPKLCTTFMKLFKKELLNVPRFRNIVVDPANPGGKKTSKLMLLCPTVTSIADLAEQAATLEKEGVELVDYQLTLDWDYWNSEQLLRAALPADLGEITSSFAQVGHIAHMNLRDAQLPYKKLIGEIILAKNKQIRTVVNKLSSIDTTFRFFQMELLAGENNYETEVKECGCRFRLKFDKVYWNSRLHREHQRIVDQLDPAKDCVADMMCGIGPFALPAGKKGCFVYANDLNPESYSSLKTNVALNKVKGRVRCYNMDGREFMRQLQTEIDTGSPSTTPEFTHVVMNLPATAHEFLDTFRGLYLRRSVDKRPATLPMIHCYCFSKADDAVTDAIAMCSAVIGAPITGEVSVHEVRDVAPKKRMMCVSFRLSEGVAYGTDGAGTGFPIEGAAAAEGGGAAAAADDGPTPKRQKVDE